MAQPELAPAMRRRPRSAFVALLMYWTGVAGLWTVPPASAQTGAPASAAIHPVTSTSALQAVVVSAASWGASSAVVTDYSWGANGWQAAFGPITANIGVNGFTATPHENDGYTPVGEYAFTTLFGVR